MADQTITGNLTVTGIIIQQGAGTNTVHGQVDMDGALQAQLQSLDKTGNYNVPSGESRTHYHNAGATGDITHTLPAGAAGLDFTFINTTTHKVTITAAAGDKIYGCGVGGSSSGGTFYSSTYMGVIRLVFIGTFNGFGAWIAETIYGTWTAT